MSILVADFQYKRGIRSHLLENNVTFTNIDGVITFSDEPLALTLIAAYNPLATVRAEARVRILDEAAIRVSAIYPHIDPDKTDVVSFYNYTIDMYQTTKTNSRNALSGRLLEFKTIRDTALAKIATINAESDYQIIEAYDASIGW